jgi:hypothetical protein
MANISNIVSAVNRVRTILDRGNSPWMSSEEIIDFLTMATNEFVRERVDIFGATQRLRDDLGDYVVSHAFNYEDIIDDENFSHWSNIGIDISSISGLGTEDNAYNFGYLLGIKIEKKTTTTEGDDTQTVTSTYDNCKVISLDDAQSILDDPFNKPEEGSYRAVRLGNIYYIMPNIEATENVDFNFHFDFVADNDDDALENIKRLPNHSREEVCQIAARRILGTIADERYQIGDAEIQQLNK